MLRYEVNDATLLEDCGWAAYCSLSFQQLSDHRLKSVTHCQTYCYPPSCNSIATSLQ